MKMVSRHPDRESANLYKAFVLLAMPLRGAIRLSKLESGADEKLRAEAAASNYILAEASSRVSAIEIMAKSWKRHGLALGGRDYRQWFGGYANDKAMRSENMKFLQSCEGSIEESEYGEIDSENIGNALQFQAGHSKKTAVSHYGRSVRGMSSDGSLDPRTVAIFIAASDEWLADAGLRNTGNKFHSTHQNGYTEPNSSEVEYDTPCVPRMAQVADCRSSVGNETVQSHLSTSQLHQASVVARAPSLILPIDLVIPHGKSRNARPNSTVIPAASTPPDKDEAANSLICADSEISHEIEIGGSCALRGADVQRDARAESSHQNSGFAHNMAHVPAVKYSFDENLDTSKALKLAVGSPNAVFKSAE